MGEKEESLEKILSPERLRPYLEETQNNFEKAIALYLFNIQLSASFYPALNFLEVTLRNRIHLVLSEAYKDAYWFKKADFLTTSQERERDDIIRKVEKMPREEVPGDVIAKLHFGFWTALFGRKQDNLWQMNLNKIVILKTEENRKRGFWAENLTSIRKFRNRISHYEPILNKGDLRQMHEMIINIMKYLSPISASCCQRIDRFESIFKDFEMGVSLSSGEVLRS